MEIELKDILFPKGRPSQERRKRERTRIAGALILSLAVHLAILLAMFPPDLQNGFSGGTGWADQIEIRSSRESSSGLEGEAGSTVDETVQVLQQINVSVVYAMPPRPEPEEYLPEDEPEEEEDVIEEEEVIIEEIIEEEVVEDEPVEEVDPEAVRALREVEAEVPTEAIGEGVGEGGMNEQLAGSPNSDAAEGLGSGNADTGRPGTFVPGGQLRDLLSGWTLIGTNGFSDGSIGYAEDHREEIPWTVYYAPNGRLQARYRYFGSLIAHGPRRLNWYSRSGRWRIEGNQLCQRIDRWGGSGLTCFEVHRDGDRIAMYYASCRGVHRCYQGRLGPEGIVRIGRHLRERN